MDAGLGGGGGEGVRGEDRGCVRRRGGGIAWLLSYVPIFFVRQGPSDGCMGCFVQFLVG